MNSTKKNPSILRKTREAIITFMSNMQAQEREKARGCVEKKNNIINQSSARFFGCHLFVQKKKIIHSLFLFHFSVALLPVPLQNMIRWKF
jgi:hypothetical protein